MVSKKFGVFAGVLVAALSATAEAQVTQLVSVATGGGQGFDYAGDFAAPSAVSPDGRYVVFIGASPNLVPGDTNGVPDVFVRDRVAGTTERVNLGPGGAEADNNSYSVSISADARYVAFVSGASTLVPGDAPFTFDVFVHDRQNGTLEPVSLGPGGVLGNGDSFAAAISADGRYVAFESSATNLVAGDTNGKIDIFVHDRQTATTERASLDSSGIQGNGDSFEIPAISADGRYVAFLSKATQLVPGDTNADADIFVRDRLNGTTERVSVDSGEMQGNAGSYFYPSISADGRYVAFDSDSPLVPGDDPISADIFVRDRVNGTTERVSVDPQGNGGHGFYPAISGDGRYVAFTSGLSTFVPGDTNGAEDVFVRDRQSGTTERVSVSSGGAQGSHLSHLPSITPDGRYVVFQSASYTLDPDDTNGMWDVFLRDRLGEPNFTSLCDPGVGGVIGCPCANPPSGLGRGCNNSSATGGAVLSASGGTYVSSDSLAFTTSAERPSALSIVSQWSGGNVNGEVFGMGVRCTSGTLKRLYTKNAVAGSITAPDFSVFEPTVTSRSTALGDVILAGDSRWYFVYYRDPNVLGGCSASGTFNATQTGQVTWSP